MPISLISVNFHVWRPCNLKCRFCFAGFPESNRRLCAPDVAEILRRLRAAGTEKINFAGGEPTLHPDIGEIVQEARRQGFVVSIITNGALLDQLLDRHGEALDWVGLSVDSASESIQAELGRGEGDHVARSLRLFDRLQKAGIAIKLNTVVTRLNVEEDMSGLVRSARPDRWKVFQVLPISGENDQSIGNLLITKEQFQSYVDRHQHLSGEGFGPVAEDNDAMTSSYVMIDPSGRFYSNHGGRYTYSRPILEVGIQDALKEVRFEHQRFIERGGHYDWQPQERNGLELAGRAISVDAQTQRPPNGRRLI